MGVKRHKAPLFIADWVLRHNALWESKGGGEGLTKKEKEKKKQFRGSARGEVIRTDI